MSYLFCIFILCCSTILEARVILGVDQLFSPPFRKHLTGKKIAILSNQTGLTGDLRSCVDVLFEQATDYTVVAIFAPEHGFDGAAHASEFVRHKRAQNVPVYSLHGETRRPTAKMLEGIDVIIYDIQDIGARSYTFISSLFYIMEEAAQKKIHVIVCDRPNPLGAIIDGPMLEENQRSYVGYINVPYCYGMTVGELARYFNQEYKIACKLTVVPMQNYTHAMTFEDTGLVWVPTSPNIPEKDSPFYYPATGILGELQIVQIGVGYTLPFKLVGAPWIDARKFADALNAASLPGVAFLPFSFKPFFGRFKGEVCHGVRLVVTNPQDFLPVSTQYLLIGTIKELYPRQFSQALSNVSHREAMFNKVNGTARVLSLIKSEKNPSPKLIALDSQAKAAFRARRKHYLLYK